jgi:hypothetical protein
MKLASIAVTMFCGTILMLTPMLFQQGIAHAYFIAAQIVGGTLCSSGIGMCFVLINPPQVGGNQQPAAA